MAHITAKQWLEIEETLPACTNKIGGPYEHRYWLAFHTPGRLYLGLKNNYPSDFISGWRMIAEMLREKGNLPEEITNLSDLGLLTKVFDLQGLIA